LKHFNNNINQLIVKTLSTLSKHPKFEPWSRTIFLINVFQHPTFNVTLSRNFNIFECFWTVKWYQIQKMWSCNVHNWNFCLKIVTLHDFSSEFRKHVAGSEAFTTSVTVIRKFCTKTSTKKNSLVLYRKLVIFALFWAIFWFFHVLFWCKTYHERERHHFWCKKSSPLNFTWCLQNEKKIMFFNGIQMNIEQTIQNRLIFIKKYSFTSRRDNKVSVKSHTRASPTTMSYRPKAK
jgi:hypothetical protein